MEREELIAFWLFYLDAEIKRLEAVKDMFVILANAD